MATIRDIAKLAGVSKSTVSNVLNQRAGSYSSDTAQRVFEAARMINYRPNALARSLASNHTHTIGVLMSDIGSEPHARALQAIESVFTERNYNVIVVNTEHSEARERLAINTLLERRIDGILFVSSSGVRDNQHLIELARSAHPLVLLNRVMSEGVVDAVEIDNTPGVARAVAHLAGLGHANIGCIHLPLAGEAMTRAGVDRMAGFRQGMQAANRAVRAEWIREGHAGEVPGIRAGYALGLELLRTHRDLTALVCGNDYLAIGAIRAAWELGLSVPRDLAVVGHDDTAAGRYHVPALTTIAQPMRTAALHAAQRLLARIGGKLEPGNIQRHGLSGQLVVRESTDPAARAKPYLPR